MTALVLALLVPWVGGAILLVADGRRPAARWFAVSALAVTLVSIGVVLATVLADGPMTFVTGGWPAGVGITIRADVLGALFAFLTVAVLLAATLHEVTGRPTDRLLPALVLLMTAGLTGVFLTGDLFNFYVFFELALAASYVLTASGGSPRALSAALVFAAVNLFGTFVFLISVAAVYHVTGTLEMAGIASRMRAVDPSTAILIAVGFFVAFGVKLGLFPFHFWLPTVYTGSRPAVAAMLSGGLANIGAYGILRFGADLLPRELEFGATALIAIGLLSILYGGVLAISRTTTAEVLAYSAIGQVGYVLVAAGLGGAVGFAAAIVYTIVNAANKTLLFLTIPTRGAVVALAFAMGAMSVAGVPPATGFVGKLEVFRAGTAVPVVLALMILGSALSFVYMFQLYQLGFWRQERTGAPSPAGQRVVVGILAVVILAGGVWPEPLLAVAHAAAGVLAGAAP